MISALILAPSAFTPESILQYSIHLIYVNGNFLRY